MSVQSTFNKTHHKADAESGTTQVSKRVPVPDDTLTTLFTVNEGGGTRNMVSFVRLDLIILGELGAASEDAAARTASYLLTFSDRGTAVQEEYLAASINGNTGNRTIGDPTITIAEITSNSFEIRVQVSSSGALSPFAMAAYCSATLLSNNATIE